MAITYGFQGAGTLTSAAPSDHDIVILRTDVYAFCAPKDGTIIYQNGQSLMTLNKFQRDTRTLTKGDIISSNNGIHISKDTTGLQGIFKAWYGNKFGFSVPRYDITAYLLAVSSTANVDMYKNGVFVKTITVTPNTIVEELVSDGSSGSFGAYTFESDNPIMMYSGRLPSDDCKPLYPASKTIYGTFSTYGLLIAVESGTTSYTVYYSDGTTTSGTLGKGGSISITGKGSQFSGASCVIVADKEIVCTSYADADGAEMTPFVAKDGFAQLFAIVSTKRDWVKFVSDKPATLRFYDSANGLIDTRVLTGQNGIYDLYINSGIVIYEGIIIEASDPVYACIEGAADDEQVLMGANLGNTIGTTYESFHNSKIVKDNLIFLVDAASNRSLRDKVSTNASFYDLINGVEGVASLTPNFTFQSSPASSLDNDGDGYYDFGSTNAITGENKNKFSMGAWVKYTQTTRGYIFNAKRSSIQSSWFGILINFLDNANGVQSTGQVGLIYSIGPSGGNNNAGHYYLCTTGDNNYNDGNWHYVSITFNSSGAYLYVDGELKNVRTTHGLATYTGNTGLLSLGSFGNTNSVTRYIGSIAKAEIYDETLSSWEILKNFDMFKSRFGISKDVNYPIYVVEDGLTLALDAANPKSYQGYGLNWYDVSGSGAIAYLINDPSFSTNNGGIININTSQRIDLGDTILESSSPEGTISIWFKTNSISTSQEIFYTKENRDRAIYIYDHGTGYKYHATAFNGTENVYLLLSSDIAVSTDWVNITFTYIQDNGTNSIYKLYVNGVEHDSIITNPTTDAPSDDYSNIGGSAFGGGNNNYPSVGYFQGSVAHFALYNRAISSSENLSNFNSLKKRYGFS